MTKTHYKRLQSTSWTILAISILASAFVSSVHLIRSADAAACPSPEPGPNCYVINIGDLAREHSGQEGRWKVKDVPGSSYTVAHTSWIKQVNGDMYEVGWREILGSFENRKYHWAKQVNGVYTLTQLTNAPAGSDDIYKIEDINLDKRWKVYRNGVQLNTGDTSVTAYNKGMLQAGGESTNDLAAMPKNEFYNFKRYVTSTGQWISFNSQNSYLIEDALWIAWCNYDRWTIGKTGSDPAGCP